MNSHVLETYEYFDTLDEEMLVHSKEHDRARKKEDFANEKISLTACGDDNSFELYNRIYNEDLTSLNSLLKKCLPLKMKRISNDKSNAGYNLYHAVPLDDVS